MHLLGIEAIAGGTTQLSTLNYDAPLLNPKLFTLDLLPSSLVLSFLTLEYLSHFTHCLIKLLIDNYCA